MKPYQPSNIAPVGGILTLFAYSAFFGVVIGGFASVVSRVIYLIVLFPLGMALLGSMLISKAVQRGKIRNSLVAVLFGVLMALVIYGTLHVGGYLTFRNGLRKQIATELGPVDGATANLVVDSILVDETGSAGFLGYMILSARQGVTFSRVNWPGDSGLHIGPILTSVYWLGELGLIVAFITFNARDEARSPFCEDCKTWYGGAEHVGTVRGESAEQFLQMIDADRFATAGDLVRVSDDIPTPSLEVYIRRCSGCDVGGTVVEVSEATRDNRGKLKLKTIRQGIVTPSQATEFMQSIQPSS